VVANGHTSEAELTDVDGREGAHFEDGPLAGRVVQERAGEHAIESRYEPSGLRVERRTDLGHRSQYDFDGAGDLRGVSFGLDPRRYSHELAKFGLPQMTQPDWEVRITRDLLGLEVARHLPGGAVATWDRDAFGRPKMRRVTTGAIGFARKSSDALKVGYQWRSAEEIGALVDAQQGPTRFDYDPRGHLIAALLPDGRVQHRASDAVGNLYATVERVDRHYGAGGRLERANGSEYQYDSLRQLVEKRLADGAAWKYRWNAAGRLAAVVRPDGGEVRFAYDALGRRVKKEFDGRTTEYVWDGDDLVHERERDAEGKFAPMVTWVFEPGTFAPLAKVVGRVRYGVVTDHLGTPAVLMTEAGEIAWKAQLDVYGVVREEVAKTACPWRWPGQYEDAETGLYYNRFRYYDPEAGRYISPDPIGLLGGTALYGYVHNPLASVDRLGLSCKAPTADPPEAEWTNLASESRTNHILYGDATGGGHLWPGGSGKTPFPETWSPDRVMHEISDVATDPVSRFVPGRGGRTIAEGAREGVEIVVVLEAGSRGGGIVTGFSSNLPRNP